MNKETIFFYFYMKLSTMKISIGNDHAGPDYKDAIVAVLQAAGYEIKNHGTNTTDSVDYPDFIHPVAKEVSTGETTFGIIICGSGNGAAPGGWGDGGGETLAPTRLSSLSSEGAFGGAGG